jgi:hypothetical protein
MIKKYIIYHFSFVFSFTLSAQPTITTDTIIQLSTCAGGNVLVPFSTTGNFGLGNIFTAQLSNAFGQFTNPINIGSFPFNIGIIPATIPASANFGFLYKIRVIASNPATIGSPCPNTLIITQLAQFNQILVSPNDTICIGDSATLSALVPIGSYLWSNGETTQSITVTQPGNYSVTVTDPLQCQTETSVEIVSENCNLGLDDNAIGAFTISPNPSSGIFQLNFADKSIDPATIQIVNAIGQIVKFVLKTDQTTVFELNLSDLESGVYFLQITEGNRKVVRRIVKA